MTCPVAVIPLPEAIISNSVAAHSAYSLFNHPAAVQSGSRSFASACASLLSSTTTNGAPNPSEAGSTQTPKPSSGIIPVGSTKAKTKDAQKDNPAASANSATPVNVPQLIAQVTQIVMPPVPLPNLPGLSDLNSAPAVAALTLGSTSANIPFQGPDSLRATLEAHGTTKQDAVGNVAPQVLAGGLPSSGPAFSFPSLPQLSSQLSPQLNQAAGPLAALVNQDAIGVAGGSPTKAPQTPSDPVSVNNNLLPQEIRPQATNNNSITGNAITVLAATPPAAVNRLNSISVQTTPAIIRSDSPNAGGRTAVSSPDAVPHDAVPNDVVPQNTAKPQDAGGSLAWSGVTLGVNAPQQNTKQENVTAPNVTAGMVRPAENAQGGHQQVTAVPSAPSVPQHSGKTNVTSADSVPNAPNKPASPPNISSELHNGSTLSNPPALDTASTPANISAISGSLALPLPQANGTNTAGTTSIVSKDNHASSSGSLAASPTTTPQSILPNKDSSNNVSEAAAPAHEAAAAQPVHRNSIPGAVQPVPAQSGALQPLIVSAPVDAGTQPAPSHAATSESLPKQSSGNLPTSAGSAHLMSNVGESPAFLRVGPVQMAQIVSKATQAEMRIGLNTSAFGNVEVRTIVHASEVGLVIGSERGDLRSLLGSEIPGIANTLQQQNLRLNEVNFHQGFTFSGNASSGGDSQPRSFTPPAAPAHYPVPEIRGDNSIEPVMTEPSGRRHTGLNILA
jgi:hypothetical protein